MSTLPGYEEARQLAASHYENFPVVSRFIKKELRDHVAIVYWFARTADDLADEGNIPEEERLQQLAEFERHFRESLNGTPETALAEALVNTIKTKELNPADFLALLSAFRQDVQKKRYKNMDELLNYCNRSANPVGHIILDLHGIHDDGAKRLSDNICTALQLTNFWQDVSVDFQKGRIYAPVSFWEKFGITGDDFGPVPPASGFRSCIRELCTITSGLFHEGEPLIKLLPRPLRFEIAWTVSGGKKILENIKKIDYTVSLERVTLTKVQYLSAAIRAVING